MDCPYCHQPILTPVWECHVEQDFCSVECGMKFVLGESLDRVDWSLNTLLGAKCSFTYKTDDFAEEYFVGPFVVSDDVMNGWVLFFNHKQHGYIHIAGLNRLVSIAKLIQSGDLRSAASFLLADILDSIGVVVSRGHWTLGTVHLYCDDTEGWSWGRTTNSQGT